jgi:two-component system, cell cycle sensor histidine kinase and response regulator CckA
VKDITPESLSDAQLAPEMWHALAAAIPDVLLVVDRDGRILYMNHTPGGLSRAEMLGSNALDFVSPSARQELRDSLQRLFATGVARSRELSVVLPGGAERWYSTHSGPIRTNGDVSAAIIVARDITEPRVAQLALAESEARYRTLVEYAPEAIVVFDVDADTFVDVNQNACSLFRLDRDLLLTSNPVALSPATQADGRPSEIAAREYLTTALDGGVPHFEWTHRAADGTEVDCEVRLVRMPSVGSRLVRGSITDVTQQRQLEQQIREWQKMDALGQLAGGIAHDFNNILTMVLASADLLSSELDDEEHRADARAIATAARKGAALTSQLLSFARRKPATDDNLIDLNDVVMEMSAILTRLLGIDITLVLELDPGRAPARIGRNQAEQALMNLVLNARDAITRDGSIHIVTRHRHADRHHTILCVRDTGSGMDPEVQRRMFEPFFSTKGGKGTGLGLSTVYAIVTQAGGTLDVRSTPGKGTTVEIRLKAD